MNRRALLAALPAIAACAAPAIAATETPVKKLFREWRAVSRSIEQTSEDDPVYQTRLDRQIDIEVALINEPCLGDGDIACKVIALTSDGLDSLPSPSVIPDFWAEVRTLVAA